MAEADNVLPDGKCYAVLFKGNPHPSAEWEWGRHLEAGLAALSREQAEELFELLNRRCPWTSPKIVRWEVVK